MWFLKAHRISPYIEYHTTTIPDISSPALYVKETKISHDSGQQFIIDGVFAGEEIPEGTYFCRCNANIDDGTIARKINDLLYKGDIDKYRDLSHTVDRTMPVTDTQTNVIYCDISVKCESFILLKTIRKIDKDEELSRYYGEHYWIEHQYIKKYGTPCQKLIFPEYTYYTGIANSYQHNFNRHEDLFAKVVDGKYYYAIIPDRSRFLDAYDVPRINKLPVYKSVPDVKTGFLLDVSKPDHSMYKIHEGINIPDNHLFTCLHQLDFLREKYENSNPPGRQRLPK